MDAMRNSSSSDTEMRWASAARLTWRRASANTSDTSSGARASSTSPSSRRVTDSKFSTRSMSQVASS